MDTTLIVAALTLATALVGIVTSTIQRNSAKTARSQEAEDVRKALDTQAQHVRETLDTQAAYVRGALDHQTELFTMRHAALEAKLMQVVRAIGANTALTKTGIAEVKAFSEVANNVNEKIKAIGLERRREDEIARQVIHQGENQ